MHAFLAAAVAASWSLLGMQAASAHEAEKVDEVRVTGHYDNAVGSSNAASQGYITPRLIETRPMLRAGELLEYVPGVIITQHSGEGKANQVFLRGFNLDHGTDFRTAVIGMPVNMPTHGHGQGYSDLNFVIPELVSRVAYTKGPYFADKGDFASAGSASLEYYTRMREGIASVGLGSWGYGRAMAAQSVDAGPGHLLYGLELLHSDGPWENHQDYRKLNGVLRLSGGSHADRYTLSAMAYQGQWNSTDQIPRRAVDAGALSRFGAVDPSDGGRSSRYSLSFDRHKALRNGAFHLDAYLIRYRLNLFSNFTYFQNDPVNGDQFEQFDQRTIAGVNPSWTLFGKWGGRQVMHRLGAELRRDNISVALRHTAARDPLNTVRADKVEQTALGLYYENSLQWTESLRTVVGLRRDGYQANVASNLDANSGRSRAGITSPKLNFILGPFERTEYFLNLGHGFHSNDARGTTITVDPAAGVPAQRVPALVKTKGAEVGVRTEFVPNLQSSFSLWQLQLASELLFVGDAGTTEASRPSVRRGVEWSNRYVPASWLLADLDLSLSRARFSDDDPGGHEIPGAIRRVVSLGLTLNDLGRWSWSAHARYFGPRPLVEDNSVRSRSSTLVALRASYKVDPRTHFNLDVFNLFNREANDIDYFYSSRLRGEAAPVSDLHFHPAEPRSVRVSLVTRF